MELYTAIIVLVIVVVIAFVFLRNAGQEAVAAGVTESELDVFKVVRWKMKRETTALESAPNQRVATTESEVAGPEARKLEFALTLVSEVAEGLVPAVEASDPWHTRQRVGAWLNIFIEGLGSALGAGSNIEKYRAALWVRDGDDMAGIAYHLFDPATFPDRLGPTSVAAYVVRTGQPHYCPDVTKCGVYVPRNPDKRRRSYSSLYAIPLGPEHEPWGAITVDARSVDGFSWVEQAIVLAFGRVASTGMGMFDIANEQIDKAQEAFIEEIQQGALESENRRLLETNDEPESEERNDRDV